MDLNKMKTEELIEYYKKIQDFDKDPFLEKEEKSNNKQ